MRPTQPIVILALTSADANHPARSTTRRPTSFSNSSARFKGVGDVEIQGASLPAVRVELNPMQLAHYGIGLEDVRSALQSANANRPKGVIDDGAQRLQIYTNDAGKVAADYAPLVIAYRGGSAVRLSDIAQVNDGVEDVHNEALFVHKDNGKTITTPAIIAQVTRQPGSQHHRQSRGQP